MSYSNRMQKNHVYSEFLCPRGRDRIYDLGMQIAQLYLSPFDRIIGFIGEASSGKSALVKGMFPGLELTNDDDGVNVRPLPLLEQDEEHGFFTPHSYHVDIRFEMAFTPLPVLAEAIMKAVYNERRVIVEHFDLVYPYLPMNAHLLIGVGEEIIIARPSIFGPEPEEIAEKPEPAKAAGKLPKRFFPRCRIALWRIPQRISAKCIYPILSFQKRSTATYATASV